MTRHTVSKPYEMIQKMPGIQETAFPYFAELPGRTAYDMMATESEEVLSCPYGCHSNALCKALSSAGGKSGAERPHARRGGPGHNLAHRLHRLEQSTVSYGDFFLNAPVLKPNRTIQHPVNGGGAPLRFSGDRLDAVRFQILFIFRTPFPWM